MDNRINNVNFIQNVDSTKGKQYKNITSVPGFGVSFEAMLKEQLDKTTGLQFSKHAKERAEQRGIDVTGPLLSNLNDAVCKIREKGAKDAVIVCEGKAFIVNVPNNIVVTALTEQEMKNNIFTNIDSAVIL